MGIKNIPVIVFLIFFPITNAFAADHYCQDVNNKGVVGNEANLSETMNKWLDARKVNYKTTQKEIGKTIKSFCASRPWASSTDVTNHLNSIVDALDGVTRKGMLK